MPENTLMIFKAPMSTDDKLDALMQKLIEIDISIAGLRSDISSTFNDEFSPDRKAKSDELGKKLLTRLKGEFIAREATAPSENYWCNACNTGHPTDFDCHEGAKQGYRCHKFPKCGKWHAEGFICNA